MAPSSLPSELGELATLTLEELLEVAKEICEYRWILEVLLALCELTQE